MTRREAIRQTQQENNLLGLGFTHTEAESLRRISMTLRRWHALECGRGDGCVERDETGRPYWLNSSTMRRAPIADRETGARKRLAAIVATRNARITNDSSQDAERHIHATCRAKLAGPVGYYVQGDPRGASLYILRPGDVPNGCDVDSSYTRGLAIA